MTWTGFSAECAGVGVGLSSKMATLPVFDVSTEYWLYQYAYCGPESGATPCAPGANSLTLTVPPAAEVPCYQLDAHLGPPLGQVGPTTNYYSGLNGSHSMLISAQNGGTGDCSSLPPCATNPAMPAGAFLCQAQTTTVPTTAGPTTTAPPTPTSLASCGAGQIVDVTTGQCVAAPPSCATGQVFDAVTGQCVAVLGSSGAALPVTGRQTGSLAITGGLFLLSGLCLVYAYRRSEAAPSA
jgi:LPXTG-motif cell wall-anchored protein